MPVEKKNILDEGIGILDLPKTRNYLVGFLLMISSIISLIPHNGIIGKILSFVPVYLFGSMYILIAIFILLLGLAIFFQQNKLKKKTEVPVLAMIGLYLFILVAISKTNSTTLSIMRDYNQHFHLILDFSAVSVIESGVQGGIVGWFIYTTVAATVGTMVTNLLYIIGIGGCAFLILRPLIYNGVNLFSVYKKNKKIKGRDKLLVKDHENSVTTPLELTVEEKLARIKVEDHNLRHVQRVNRFFIKEDEIKAPSKVIGIEILSPSKGENKTFEPISKTTKSDSISKKAEVFNVFKDPVFAVSDSNKSEEINEKPSGRDRIFFEFSKADKPKPVHINNSFPLDNEPTEKFKPLGVADIPVKHPLPEEYEPIKKQATIDVVQINEHSELKQPVITPRTDNYQLPPIDLLKQESIIKTSVAKVAAEYKAELLNQKLTSFGIDAHVKDFVVAPAFTRFIVELGSLAKMQQFSNVKNDLMGALSAEKINILAPIPGSQYVGVEIPNKERSTVSFKDVFSGIPFEMRNKKLLIALGKNIVGDVVTTELNKAPHMLIAGQTGSGKSVCINTIIIGLLMRCHPDDVKLILVDPKRVELAIYGNIPHLLCPVISDPKKAAVALSRLVEEIEDRFTVLEASGYKNVDTYNSFAAENKQKPFPYIVAIIDELADLMLVASKLVEDNIRRITALARAAGIHLIVATQRPSVDVITGVIKANIPTRLAFAVSSGVDSRTILDEVGAEELLGNGDMMFRHPSLRVVERIQGSFISDSDIEAVVEFIKKQAKPNYNEKFMNLDLATEQMNLADSLGMGNSEVEDEYYQEVIEYLKTAPSISTSSIQRRFAIGFQRAGRIIDRLENDGYISPANGSKPRDIYHSKLGEK